MTKQGYYLADARTKGVLSTLITMGVDFLVFDGVVYVDTVDVVQEFEARCNAELVN